MSKPTETGLPTPEIGVTLATMTPTARGTKENIIPAQMPSPTLSATPTPTPTPYIYIVAEGDTLFDIAARYETTIEAILELNPGLQPELLSIGQELILPEQAPADPAVSAIMPDPLSLAVSGLSLYQTPANGIWLLGEIINQGEQDLENVQLVVGLQNDAGQIVHEERLRPATNIVLAGTKSPFGTLIVPAPAVEVIPTAYVAAAAPIVDLGNRYLDFEMAEVEESVEGAQATISGKIVNAGARNVSEVALIATLYDDEGHVTGYHKSFLDQALAAGNSLPFEIHVLPPGDRVHDYALLAQGLIESTPTPQ